MRLGHRQWLGDKNVSGNLPESLPPVTVISSPQHRLVELKVKHLLY